MNIPNKNTIIERIKSLLALGDSSRNPYEEEVKTALKMAQQLMKKYNLTLSEVDVKNSTDDKINQKHANYAGHLEHWKRELAHLMRILYDVDPIIDYAGYHKHCYLFVGFEIDCKLAAYTYDYLCDLIDFRSKLKYKGKRLQRQAYLQGLLACLLDRAEKEKKRSEAKNLSYGSLMIVKTDRVNKWVSEHIKTHQVHYNSELNLEDLIEYEEGYKDGKKIKLNNKKELK